MKVSHLTPLSLHLILVCTKSRTHRNVLCFQFRKMLEEERQSLNINNNDCDKDQTEEELEPEKAEDSNKKSNMSRGESKQSQISQDTSKKGDSKRGTAGIKESQAQLAPDLEEEEICRDAAIIGVSMGTVVTGAKIKGLSLYQHLAKLVGKEVNMHSITSRALLGVRRRAKPVTSLTSWFSRQVKGNLGKIFWRREMKFGSWFL